MSHVPDISKKWSYKVDISNYFNSVDVKRLLEKLLFIKEKDAMLYQLFEKILLEERVTENGKVVKEKHGAMAGTAFSPFLAKRLMPFTTRCPSSLDAATT